MKVANIFIVYKDPEQVERVVKTMSSHPDFDCWIHLDKKVNLADYAGLLDIPRVRFVKNRVSVKWAGFSFVQSMLVSLEEIFESGIKYDFVNLMSGQDFPIKPIDYIHDYLSQHKGSSFIESEPEPSEWWSHALQRLTRYHMTDYRFKGKTRLEGFLNKALPSRKSLLSSQLHGGPNSTYWTLSLEAAKYVCEFLKANRRKQWLYKHTWAPDEFLFSTILMNSHLRSSIINKSLKYVDWSNGGARPGTMGVKDYYALKESSKLFARKFDIREDAAILDLVEAELLDSSKLIVPKVKYLPT